MTSIFSSVRVNEMCLPHRIITGPMERGMANRDGTLTTRYIEYLAARAAGGAALLQLESTYVDPRGMGHLFQAGCHHDGVVPALRRAADAVHAHGARLALELYLGGRETPSYIAGRQPIAPSPVRCDVLEPPTTPREMTHADIDDVVDRFRSAARRARAAGIDMVHIHGAHGYLVGSFLSPYSNRRDDEFGGSLRNRARFPLLVVEALRDELGRGYPLGYRMSVEEFLPDGLRLDESRAFAGMLAAAGVDLIDVSGGIYETSHTIIQGSEAKAAPFVPAALAIKSEVGDGALVSVAQRLSRPGVAQQVISQGLDLVSLTRAFHADPEYVNKLRAGADDQIVPCVACHHCTNMLEANRVVDCAVNPLTTRERYAAAVTSAAAERQRVLVVGGGPAGMQVASLLAGQRHSVVLVESLPRLGGQLRWSSKVHPDYRDYLTYAEGRVRAAGDVDVVLETRVDLGFVDGLTPDVVVVATGAIGMFPWYACEEGVQPLDLLSAFLPEAVTTGTVVIAGGDAESCSLALYAADRGAEVVLVDPGTELARDRPPPGRGYLTRQVDARTAIEVRLESTVEACGPGWVEVQSGGSPERLIGVGHVVTGGRRSENALAEELLAQGRTNVYVIGDAVRPRDVHRANLDALRAAAVIGRRAPALALI